MTQKQGQPRPTEPSSLKAEAGNALTDAALGKVSGGTDPAPTTTSTVLKTKHDTAKNSISNIR